MAKSHQDGKFEMAVRPTPSAYSRGRTAGRERTAARIAPQARRYEGVSKRVVGVCVVAGVALMLELLNEWVTELYRDLW